MTKVLAIDVGEKRVGLATTDETRMIAAPYGFLEREGSVAKIVDIIRVEEIGQLVIGMPYLPSGDLGSQAEDIEHFAADLGALTSLNITFENEILSSVEASNRLKGMKRKIKDKGEVDAMAATIILEGYLSRR